MQSDDKLETRNVKLPTRSPLHPCLNASQSPLDPPSNKSHPLSTSNRSPSNPLPNLRHRPWLKMINTCKIISYGIQYRPFGDPATGCLGLLDIIPRPAHDTSHKN
jgi:hypothetical protein